MPNLAPTGSQLDHLLDASVHKRRRRHRRPRKRQRVRARQWREKMVRERRARRALTIRDKQQHQQETQRGGKNPSVPVPSKEVPKKNIQTVQAEAAKEVAAARATMAQQQGELSALKIQLSMLQLSKDALQQSAKTAVLGLQSQVSEAQQLQNSASLALRTTKDELHSMTKTSDTFYLKLKQLQKMCTESDVEVSRLLDENTKMLADTRAADEDYEEQERHISQIESIHEDAIDRLHKLQLEANGLRWTTNHLMVTYGVLQEEI